MRNAYRRREEISPLGEDCKGRETKIMSVIKKSDRFAMIPEHVLKGGLTPRELSIWAALAYRAGPNILEVWAAVQSIANDLGCCLDTVRRAIRSLVKK